MDQTVWNKALEIIKNDVSDLSFSTWFKNLGFLDIKDHIIRLVVPHILYKNHIESNYKTIILDTCNSLIDTPLNDIQFILKDSLKDLDNTKEIEQLENEADNINYNYESNLIKKYTFDNFVVGESNTFAQAAALAVAENPGHIYNPLFIYGNSGLGKTHLMHAIGNYIKEVHNKKVLYVTCDQFMEDFTGLSRKSSKDNNIDYITFFKNKYRNIDVLILDDIQFLASAQKTQEEFFHTFNNLHNNNKQIIISSDRSPEDLKLLEERLKTRFYWGLEVNIDPPDLNLKVNIIKKKIKGERIAKEIPDNVINYMANNCGNDVRQLEGSLNRLIAYSTIMGFNEINLDVAKEALKDQFKKSYVATDQNNIRKIQKIVSDFYKISFEDIKSKKKSNNIAIPRQVAMYLCRKLTDESFPRIGIEFGGKNHTTVMHSCTKIEHELKNNKELRDSINIIEKQLQ